MGEWISYKLKNLLSQYRETHIVKDDVLYGQITISKSNGVSFREKKIGRDIGRKRQFFINLNKYPDTLIFTRQGIADGAIGLAPKEVDGCIATENMPMFSVNTKRVLPELLKHLIRSSIFKNKVQLLTPIGSAQKAIHERDLLELDFILPKELNDQKKLADFLDIQINEINKLFKTIEFDLQNLNLLRQTILQEAVEGKLTEDWRKKNPVRKGDPDMDAVALLEKIKQEKQKLIAEGKIKKEKPLEPVKPEEVPFELPEGWVWCRLGEISDIAGGIQKTPFRSPKKNYYPYLGVQNVQRGFLYLDEYGFFEATTKEFEKLKLEPNDLLIIEGNGSINEIGRCAIWNGEIKNCIHQNHVIRTRLINAFMAKYILKTLNSPAGIKQMQEKARTTTGLFNLSVSKIKSILVPLPPLAEQQVIIERVDRLLAMVDELGEQVKDRKEQAEELMQAVLREAFEGK